MGYLAQDGLRDLGLFPVSLWAELGQGSGLPLVFDLTG